MMTLNEIMRDLMRMIGKVEWREQDGEQTIRSWLYLQQRVRGMLTRYEWYLCFEHQEPGHSDQIDTMLIYGECAAQALIQQAAIEWLNRDGRGVKIYGPNCNYADGERATDDGEWLVTVFRPFITIYGSTLLEALHAAVTAVKESK